MKTILKTTLKGWLLVSSLWMVLPVFAADDVPSDALIVQVLEASGAGKTLDALAAQMDNVLDQNIQQALKGHVLTDRENAKLTQARKRVVALLQAELSLEALTPDFLLVYRNTFTRSELDGMLVFYRSPAGKAMVAKMPLLMQQSMALSQMRIQRMTPQIEAIMEEELAILKSK